MKSRYRAMRRSRHSCKHIRDNQYARALQCVRKAVVFELGFCVSSSASSSQFALGFEWQQTLVNRCPGQAASLSGAGDVGQDAESVDNLAACRAQ